MQDGRLYEVHSVLANTQHLTRGWVHAVYAWKIVAHVWLLQMSQCDSVEVCMVLALLS